jgi:hypothetical protein
LADWDGAAVVVATWVGSGETPGFPGRRAQPANPLASMIAMPTVAATAVRLLIVSPFSRTAAGDSLPCSMLDPTQPGWTATRGCARPEAAVVVSAPDP